MVSIDGVKIVYDINSISFNEKGINSFKADKILPKLKAGKPKFIGYINVTSNKIGVGELVFNILPAIKGRYDIFSYNGSLIAIHQSTSFHNQIFTKTKYLAGCDIGCFAFSDVKRLTKYMVKYKSGEYGFPFIDPITNVDHFYIYENDFIYAKNLPSDADDIEPIALFSNNKYGDGNFNIYKGNHAYWIMSLNVYDAMSKLVGI